MAAAIRLATADDATGIARIYEPAVTQAPISFEATPPDAAQMATRIRDTLMSTHAVDPVVPNPASIGLHKSVGFTSVGTYRSIGYKLGAWHDVEWLELALAEHVPEPPGWSRAT